MSVAVIAEKPSVARDLASVLGATRNEAGALAGRGYVVTWAVGHLVGLAEPHDIEPAWRVWRADRLPMIPSHWPLKVLSGAARQFQIVKKILDDPAVDRIVCATDAGREGELIFRYIYRLAGCRKPVARLWISSLTPDAIRDGFARLRPSREFDALADAAEARSRADWLVGMNLTRAYTLQMGGDLFSVGRVQTPTLAMIAERDKAIRDFVPEPYFEVRAQFGPPSSDAPAQQPYEGTWFDPAKQRKRPGEGTPPERLPADGDLARAICDRCQKRDAVLASMQGTDKSMPAPLLHDLTELQRQANRLYGLTAGATLAAAQSLYEKHKLISYPRTDSRHLTADVAVTLQPIVEAIAPQYPGLVAPGSGSRPLSKRYVDDTKVSDHHAIIPTGKSTRGLRTDEQRVYDLICRRLLMAWHGDYKTRTTRVVTEVRSPGEVDHFASSGTVVLDPGWKVLDVQTSRAPDPPTLPWGLAEGLARVVSEIAALRKETSPPKHFNDATLLTAMESAGSCLDDRELEQAMRDRGLGTPATRAAVIETLLDREYVRREGKSLLATDKGMALIDAVHEKVKSPAMTGEWEYALRNIEQRKDTLESFTGRIEKYVVEVLGEVVRGVRKDPPSPLTPLPPGEGKRRAPPPTGGVREIPSPEPPISFDRHDGAASVSERARTPGGTTLPMAFGSSASTTASARTSDATAILKTRFGHDGFRPHQEEICKAVIDGNDALVVMPTGSGKSLCYQVPGIARGATLVISPLIALMEDQTARLCALGFAAERIHSGRSREQSRAVCRAWLDGKLDYLMIAPERLAVPGFPEMLARRKPALIAVDEAHCISHWGHDFRPDYRLIGERIPMLRPAPIIAMTATATVRVQDDICAQMGIDRAKRFIHGFRRHNLGIEIVEAPPGQRFGIIDNLLRDKSRLPAIVYAPTRKTCDEYAKSLGKRMRAAAYHAGMLTADRSRVQDRFLSGDLSVIIATIAFGMGVDKRDIRTVIHASLPGSIEGYYQEIGRAGRDGEPSRVILLYSYADRMMHETFLARDYPPPVELERLLEMIPASGLERELVVRDSGMKTEEARSAIDKLWIHGGVTIDAQDRVAPTGRAWQRSYDAIRAHRAEQLEMVFNMARAGGCRMVRLVRHFGDLDDREPCGVCDECAPAECSVRKFREPTAGEQAHIVRILRTLRERDGLAAGTLFKLFAEGEIDRDGFESYIDAMVRAKVAAAIEETFEKDGKTIKYRRMYLQESETAPAVIAARLRLQASLPGGAKTRKPRKQRAPRTRGPELMVSRTLGPKTLRPKGGKKRSPPKAEPKPAPARAPDLSGRNDGLIARLRSWRMAVAAQRRVPAYRVITDDALYGIAAARPANAQALLQVKGIGEKIAERYGLAILQIVEKFGAA
jgi:DNA topoisomerase III